MADKVEQVSESVNVDGNTKTVRREVNSTGTEEKVNYTSRVIWFIISILLVLLAIRLVLSLLGAYEGNGFASFIYGITAPFVAPFQGMFRVEELQNGVSTFEIPVVVAMVIYTLVGWLFSAGVRLLSKKQ